MANHYEGFAAEARGGARLLSGWAHLSDPMAAEALAREAFDAVIIDMQHGQVGLDAAFRTVPLVAGLGKPCIARIPVGHFAEASRLLDAGAAGVIAPMINSEADARAFAGFMKYPPVGGRSWGANRGLWLSGLKGADYLGAANGFTFAVAMIETREALAALDAILAVPGIDGVFVGPGDLSIALTDGARIDPADPRVDDALRHVAARASAHGKVCWAYAHTGRRAREMHGMGVGLAAVGSDLGFIRQSAAAEIAVAREGAGPAAGGGAGGY
jgi:4-hydroxy-2-oxoheptanedioate aldolase